MSFWAAFVLIAIGILAIYMEFFVPAFGLIGIGGIGVIIATVVFGYRDLPDYQATIILITAIIVTPSALVILLRRFPESRFGNRLILRTQLDSQSSSHNGPGTDRPTTTLVGQPGTATTPLHPTGVATIEGKRYSVVTNGEYLDTGTPIEVYQQFGPRIVVRRAPDTIDSQGETHDN